MTMPVPIPLTRLTEEISGWNGSAALVTVFSLWMLTTAPLTLRATSTAGVTRGFEVAMTGEPAQAGVIAMLETSTAAANRRATRCKRPERGWAGDWVERMSSPDCTIGRVGLGRR